VSKNSACCAAARALIAKRFLSAEAPRLPLADCAEAGSCPCAYKHHADRRAQPRRAVELGGLRRGRVVLEQERRTLRGRRETDC
jgi:hypothetical protein